MELFVEFLHHIRVSSVSESQIMSICEVPRSFVGIVHLLIILVEDDHSSAQFSAIIEFSQLLVIIVRKEVCDFS